MSVRRTRRGAAASRWGRRAGLLGAATAAVIALGALATAAGPAATQPDAGAPVRFVPKARKLSTYTQQVRVELTTKDATFEAPPAYQETFAFWFGRMKDVTKAELIEFSLSSLEPDDDGSLPFTRRVSRFMLEIVKNGKPMEPRGPLMKQIHGLAWEGALDRHGNITRLEKVAGEEFSEMKDLSFPLMEGALPRLEPVELEVGKGFEDRISLPLPSRLKIRGLEEIRMIRTREYRLKSASSKLASFEIKTTYENDPDRLSTAADTTCVISGGGTGKADFDLLRGVLLTQRHTGLVNVEFEAPLSPLPNKPETEGGGTATARLELEVKTSVRQKVTRLWGKDED
jgi:hypothetical protein